MKWPMDKIIFTKKKIAAGKIFLRKDCAAGKIYRKK